MDYKNYRILHEFEITDTVGQHFANVIYLRECSEENTEKTGYIDVVDTIMDRCIIQGCKVVRKLPPRVIALDTEVDELNKRLVEEYQVKAYFSFYAPSETKGGIPTDFSRVTIHVTVLVKEETEIRYFENIGYYENVIDASLISQFALVHFKSPVYLLQEHPLVHGIVCYKDASRANVVYFLYRHNANPLESILAEVDLPNNTASLKLGTDREQCCEIASFAESVSARNNLSPLYQCSYETELAPRYFTRLLLNRERDLFEKAKAILLKEFEKKIEENNCCKAMAIHLNKMIEA